MKCELDALHKDLKDSRNKEIQDIAIELKSEFLSPISQLSSESKKIDELISQKFLKMRESSEKKSSIGPNNNEMHFNRQIEQPFNLSQQFSKSRSVMKE